MNWAETTLLADMSVDDHHTSSLDPTAGSSFHASEDSAEDNDCSEFTDDEQNPPGSAERKHPVDQEKIHCFWPEFGKRCQECGEVIVEVNKRTNGSLLTVKATCMAGCSNITSLLWKSLLQDNFFINHSQVVLLFLFCLGPASLFTFSLTIFFPCHLHRHALVLPNVCCSYFRHNFFPLLLHCVVSRRCFKTDC